MKAIDIRSDTLTLLLASAMARHLNVAQQAQKIRKCAKVICGRTKDKILKDTCRRIRNEKDNKLVVDVIDNAEYKYLMTY